MNTFALIGAPNSGKSTLFNLLTNKNQKIANYPGVTVESSIGSLNQEVKIIDLPGLYGLKTKGLDEKIARDYIIKDHSNPLLAKFTKEELNYHSLIIVADATKLAKSMYLCIELKRLNIPTVLVLSRTDLSEKRNQEIDIEILKKHLAIPVYETSRLDKNSIVKLKEKIVALAKTKKQDVQSINSSKLSHLISVDNWSKDTFDEIDSVLKEAIIKKIRPDTLSDKIDNILTHPVSGPIFLLIIMYCIFQTLFEFSGPFQDMISNSFDALSSVVASFGLPPMFESFITDGVIAGIGGSVVFLPQIIFLFLFIGIMEETGYLSRVAYLLDTFMMKMGLPGKAIIPLISSHACAIPGIMSTRSLNNERDRMITTLVAPLTQCSARLPVYVLLLACFLPLSYQGPALLLLYVIGIVSSFLVAFVMKFILKSDNKQAHLIELPSYQLPNMKMVLKNVFSQAWEFLKNAGTVIVALTIVLWFLTYFPSRTDPNTGIEHSYAGKLANIVMPVFEPLGFDHKLTVALIPSFAAREVMVSTLATVMAVDDPESEAGLSNLQETLSSQYSLGVFLALIVWFIFAPQCISTFAVIKRETHGYKWPFIAFAYSLILAYVLAFLVKLFFS